MRNAILKEWPEQEDFDTIRKGVLGYFRGEKIKDVDTPFRRALYFDTTCKSFFQRIPLREQIAHDNPETHQRSYTLEDNHLTQVILAELGITRPEHEDPENPSYYARLMGSGNLYDLLVNLYHDGYHHIGYLLTMIDGIRIKKSWLPYQITGIIFCIGTGTFFSLQPDCFYLFLNWMTYDFPKFVMFAYHFLYQLHNLPLFGIVIDVIRLIWVSFDAFFYGTKISRDKTREFLFKTLAICLLIIARSISYASKGQMSATTGFLFILSSLVLVIENLYTLQVKYSKSQKTPLDETSTHIEKADKKKEELLREQTLWELGTNLVATLLITVSIIIWCSFATNIGLGISCMLFGWLITFMQETTKSFIHTHYANYIQDEIGIIRNSITAQNYSSTLLSEIKDYGRDAKQNFATYCDGVLATLSNEAPENINKRTLLTTKMNELLRDPEFSYRAAKCSFTQYLKGIEDYSRGLKNNSLFKFRDPAANQEELQDNLSHTSSHTGSN